MNTYEVCKIDKDVKIGKKGKETTVRKKADTLSIGNGVVKKAGEKFSKQQYKFSDESLESAVSIGLCKVVSGKKVDVKKQGAN